MQGPSFKQIVQASLANGTCSWCYCLTPSTLDLGVHGVQRTQNQLQHQIVRGQVMPLVEKDQEDHLHPTTETSLELRLGL